MYLKILVKDYKRKKVITNVLFVFMLLAAALAAGGTRMFLALTGAMDNLFTKANTAHYVQFHTGPYDEAYVQQWTCGNPYIKEWSVQEIMAPADIAIFANESKEEIDLANANIYFTVQNNTIDILLDLENQRLSVTDGHIAVPVIYMQREGLQAGDTLNVKYSGYEKSFIISGFIRDSQFGNTMMGAKRFLLSDGDFREMADSGADSCMLFSFLLKEESMLSDFTRAIQSSDIPQNGSVVDMSLFRLAHGAFGGITAGLVLLCSTLLVLVGFLTLRYTILSTIEEDFREIGIMKAIGFSLSGIIKLYVSKYLYLTSAACVLGFFLGQPLSESLSSDLLLYLGTPENSMTGVIASAGSAALILMLILSFCLLTLLRIGKMTVMDAIRMGSIGETYKESKLLSLARRPFINVNVFIGLKDILLKLKAYILLFIVFLLCAFICILPINVKNTFAAPDSLNYFGFAACDITATSGNSDLDSSMKRMIEVLQNDADVIEWEIFLEEYHQIKIAEDQSQRIRTIVGGQTSFMPEYTNGAPPILPNEVALSYLTAKDLNKSVGDSIIMEIDGEEKYLLVSGIFQDISNGGRCIRACFETNISNAYFWQAYFNVSGDAVKKVREYKERLGDINISTLEEVSDQFMKDINTQMDSISKLLMIIAMVVSALITALFIKMLTTKETTQIAIMKSLGFSGKHIRTQYVTRIGSLLIIAIISGTAAANILGEKILSAVAATMGAVRIRLTTKPMEVYVIYPFILLAAVSITVMLSLRGIRKISISQINTE